MKIAYLALAGFIATMAAQGAVQKFEGSDTLAGVMNDAVKASGLDKDLQYVGGGSGKGEKALLAGTQGIAPMSREAEPAAIQTLKAKGIRLEGTVLALDGIMIFVNKANALGAVDLDTLRAIYTCQTTLWQNVPNSGKTGTIRAYRRNDESGTTDTFKNLVGVKSFGPCVQKVEDTADIGHHTESEADAIGYAGHSAHAAGNKALAIARDAAGLPYLPTIVNIRAFTYPLSRRLFIYEVAGQVVPNAAEAKFLHRLKDRSFLDPIVQANEFYTLD